MKKNYNLIFRINLKGALNQALVLILTVSSHSKKKMLFSQVLRCAICFIKLEALNREMIKCSEVGWSYKCAS